MLKTEYNIVATMSGTSLDGLDIAYVTFKYTSKWDFEIKAVDTIAYAEEWYTILSKLTETPTEALRFIDIKYSKYLADAVLQFIEKNTIETIDFIASHGHTAWHQPAKGFTYQIGNHQILADELNRKVICDFRVQDVALGGQGAPPMSFS